MYHKLYRRNVSDIKCFKLYWLLFKFQSLLQFSITICILICIKIHRALKFFYRYYRFSLYTYMYALFYRNYLFNKALYFPSSYIYYHLNGTNLLYFCILVFSDPSIHIIIQSDHQGHSASVSNTQVATFIGTNIIVGTLSSRTSSSSSSTSSFLRDFRPAYGLKIVDRGWASTRSSRSNLAGLANIIVL